MKKRKRILNFAHFAEWKLNEKGQGIVKSMSEEDKMASGVRKSSIFDEHSCQYRQEFE